MTQSLHAASETLGWNDGVVCAGGVLGVLMLSTSAAWAARRGLDRRGQGQAQARTSSTPPRRTSRTRSTSTSRTRFHLIGYKFEPESRSPAGGEDHLLDWRCDDTLDDGWALFTHLQTTTRRQDRQPRLDGPLRESKNNRQILGPDQWEKGKFYVDEHELEGAQGHQVPAPEGVRRGSGRTRAGLCRASASSAARTTATTAPKRASSTTGLSKPPPVQPDKKTEAPKVPELTVNKLAPEPEDHHRRQRGRPRMGRRYEHRPFR